MRNLSTLMRRSLALVALLAPAGAALAQDVLQENKFEQIDHRLPTPNTYRTASGAPGAAYWQQRADYVIDVTLDDEKQRITGRETITYTNNSPDALTYLWLQLDQNINAPNSDTRLTETGRLSEQVSFTRMINDNAAQNFDGGFKIGKVTDATGKALKYTINKTMMRIDLPAPLRPGQKYVMNVEWAYNINDCKTLGGRSGYEYFPEDKNYLYEIAQFFPRMAVYSDLVGWQHKQFLGRGEFTLPFGDYRVSITLPADIMVGATGELQNATQVLTAAQQQRLAQARTSSKPVLIVTEAEARENEKSRSTAKKTWVFAARNVRDFAFAASRKFIWDAMNVNIAGKNILAMSYYPKEGNPLWGQYSTEAVAHTLRVYSKYSVDYAYPVAISVHGPIFGMEYPMICFNGGRPEADGTYSERLKYALISVIIHEVGHNFFPMIVNSDERQWTWMDEGLNSFLQFLAEQEWDHNYPSTRGFPETIVDYMRADKSVQNPIMVNSESILSLGNNAYGKPAAALNILRETVMGRELFDMAFKTYSQRWAYRHPYPADFFRTMEDASAVDLDWFWRGWFYTTDNVDLAITGVAYYRVDTQNPEVELAERRKREESRPEQYSLTENKRLLGPTLVETNPAVKDFYNSYDVFTAQPWQKQAYQTYLASLTPEERVLAEGRQHYYQVDFENKGGLVMPIILLFQYEDGSEEVVRIPAEIWRLNDKKVSKVFARSKPIKQIYLDPYRETADIDENNNAFPPRMVPSKFQLYKQRMGGQQNPMQLQKRFSTPAQQPAGSN